MSLPRNVRRLGLKPETKYVSQNETQADLAWEAIEAGHGIVAFSNEQATKQGLSISREHPYRPGHMVYGLEAYHAIHCLVRLICASGVHRVLIFDPSNTFAGIISGEQTQALAVMCAC